MKIYTRKGDEGQTSLIGGTRVPKHHIRIEAYGTVDELNSWMGMIRDEPSSETYRDFLKEIQNKLFTLGSLLAADPEKNRMELPEISKEDIEKLESSMDEMDATLPQLKNFVLPGGHPANSAIHVARCVCRRAERNATHLAEIAEVDPIILKYLNRLSDWLFMFARKTTALTASEEITWEP